MVRVLKENYGNDSFLDKLTDYLIDNTGLNKYSKVKCSNSRHDIEGGHFDYMFPLNDKYFAHLHTENYQHGTDELRASLVIVDINDIKDAGEYTNPLYFDVDDSEIYSGRIYADDLDEAKDGFDDFISKCKSRINKYSSKGSSNSRLMHKFLINNANNFGDYR